MWIKVANETKISPKNNFYICNSYWDILYDRSFTVDPSFSSRTKGSVNATILSNCGYNYNEVLTCKVAIPTAQATGFPPKVLKWRAFPRAWAILGVVTTAANG